MLSNAKSNLHMNYHEFEGTVRIWFKKLLTKKEIQYKKDFLVTKMQITVIDDSK